MTVTVGDIAAAIERFAPLSLQESYDNSGLQIGNPLMGVTGVLLCVDVTEEVLDEAADRRCNMIVSHHPLLFKGLKHLTGATPTERIAMRAVNERVAIYSGHTNVDNAPGGTSREMARLLRLHDITVLRPSEPGATTGTGVVGSIDPMPTLEFLRHVKEQFGVKALKFSAESSKLVIRRVALCGGSGAEFIGDAIRARADVFVTGDVKYHDFTTYASEIVIADIGHHESEECTRQIFERVIRDSFKELVVYLSEADKNPVGVI